jgi:hypothetical protein
MEEASTQRRLPKKVRGAVNPLAGELGIGSTFRIAYFFNAPLKHSIGDTDLNGFQP